MESNCKGKIGSFGGTCDCSSKQTNPKELIDEIYKFLNKVMKVRFSLAEIKENELNLEELKKAEIELEIFLCKHLSELKKEEK